MIQQTLSRWFNIKMDEGPGVLLMCLINGMGNIGFIWAYTIIYAGFLRDGGGIRILPWLVGGGAVLSISITVIYTFFADLISDDKLMAIIFIGEGVGIIFGIGLLWFNYPHIAYPFLYLLMLAIVDIFNAHKDTYFNSFYDTQAAKRVLPIIAAASRIGAIIAGLTVGVLNQWFSSIGVIFGWLFVHILLMILAWFGPYLLERKGHLHKQVISNVASSIPRKRKEVTYFTNMKEGLQYTVQSSYLRWMAVATFVMMILMAFLEYRHSELLLVKGEDLAGYLGFLVSVGNLFALPMLLFVMNRVIVRVGVGNMSLVYPIMTLLAGGALIVMPNVTTASLALLTRSTFRLTFHSPLDGLLYNAVPVRIKGRARGFVRGFLMPIGSLVGSLALILPLVSTIWFIPAVIMILAIVYAVASVVIRHRYSQALIKMLEEEDYSFVLLQQTSELQITDRKTFDYLEQKLQESTDPDFIIFMAKLISQIGGNEATQIIVRAVKDADNPLTQATLIDIMVATQMQGEAVRKLYTDFLNHFDGNVRQSALAGLEWLYSTNSRTFYRFALQVIQDPDIEVRLQALSAIAKSGQYYQTKPAQFVLRELLDSPDVSLRARAIKIVSLIGDTQALQKLLNYLLNPIDELRLSAAIGLERIPDEVVSIEENEILLLEKLPQFLTDPIERIRLAILSTLDRIVQPQAYKLIIKALNDESTDIRSVAVNLLVQKGEIIIDLVEPLLDSNNVTLQKMAAIVLSRIDEQRFGSHILTYIITNLKDIYCNHGYLQAISAYRAYPSITVLESTLKEQNQALQNQIFTLLSGLHETEAIKPILEGFNNKKAYVRANALEALETLTDSQTAKLIGLLFNPDVNSAELLTISQETWHLEHPTPTNIIQHLIKDTSSAWLRAMMIFILGEMGAVLQANGNTSSSTNIKRKLTEIDGEVTDNNDSDKIVQDMVVSDLPFFTQAEIETILAKATKDADPEVRLSAYAAQRILMGLQIAPMRLAVHASNKMSGNIQVNEEEFMLSTIEKIIFLKKVPFFKGMTIDQLKSLGSLCEEKLFEEDSYIYKQGEPGGSLYVVVNGKVGIEREGKRKGSSVRLFTLQSHGYFGEMNLFDEVPRTTSAYTLQDSLVLQLRREPLIALARQHPDVSLELIKVLSKGLRDASDRLADKIRTRPRELHKLYDQLG